MSSFLSITSLLLLMSCLSLACRNSAVQEDDDALEGKLGGEISYPFVKGQPLGVNGKKDPFIIRSRIGETEYSVEIPDAGEEYNIEIPLAALDPHTAGQASPHDLAATTAADRELTTALPQIAQKPKNEAGLVDRAFGVGETPASQNVPSYTLGLAKINELYKKKEFEYALIEIDHLLSFFPNSPKLYKMKGTIFMHSQEYKLADKAWAQALELDPADKVLRKSLQDLHNQQTVPATGNR